MRSRSSSPSTPMAMSLRRRIAVVERNRRSQKLKIVPYTVHQLSFGDIKEENVPSLYDGPFPWQYMFGLHLAGMVGHDFFKPYAVTFDFQNMQIFLQ